MWAAHRLLPRSSRSSHRPNQGSLRHEGEPREFVSNAVARRSATPLAPDQNSSAYFLADSSQDQLQRIYGMSFPDAKKMTEYKKFLEEAAKRDHRKIGKAQELFMFHELSPGSAFFLPMGMRIYNALLDFIKVSTEMLFMVR
jgi:hypothetical protein